MLKTYVAKPAEVKRRWLLIDAEGQVLGRLAAQVAAILRGKHRPTYTPHVDTGDYVVIVNAAKVLLTGQKAAKKMRYRHSGYIGGLKVEPYGKFLARRPEEAFREAVRGMLPHNPLGRRMLTKLKAFAGPQHNLQAQRPQPYSPFAQGRPQQTPATPGETE